MAGPANGNAYLRRNTVSAVLKPDQPTLRPMDETDLESVLAIENEAYPYPWSGPIFLDCLHVGYCCWVIERGSALLAYGIMSVGAGECHVLNLCVNPQFQGMGYGRAMLEHLLEIAISHHAETAFLEVRPTNFSAMSLYMNAGFNEVGVRRNYYPAKCGREDAIILARALINV